MRILVYPHDLAIGGSQINAIELARGVADLGHELTVFGAPGPLVSKIREIGLDFVASPEPGLRPSPRVLQALTDVVRQRRIEVLHGYEWPPILEAWLVARRTGAVAVGTVMSMAVAGFLPHRIPLLVGTEQIADAECLKGRQAVGVLEPPVDLANNHPELGLDTAAFREEHGIQPTEVLVVVVSRLAIEMKREGIVTAARVVGELSRDQPVRLMIVGDGPARRDVETIAAGLETTPGGDAPVVLIGEMSDPRVAYAAADIVLGMGSSALRAMAFAKPVVVQGESGFWSMLGPDTLDHFLWTGWYGVGASPEAGPRNLRDQLQPLIGDAQLRFELGRYALDVVTDRFSLAAASRKQVDHYAAELTRRLSTSRDVGDTAHSSALFARYQVGRRVQQLVGNAASDDFNARPVAAAATPRPETP